MDAPDHDRFEDVGIVRLTTWATAAAVALTVAALASLSAAGSHRVSLAWSALTGSEVRPTQVATRQTGSESERRGLNEALRLLAADRDRLITRISSLERNLDDVTGSIRGRSATPTAETAGPQPAASSELPVIAADPKAAPQAPRPDWLAGAPIPWPNPSAARDVATVPSAASSPPQRVATLPPEEAAVPAPPPQPAPSVSRTEFGVDIGSGSNLEEVRYLWSAARAQHGQLIGKLRPIIVQREDVAGNPDYRLVVGPFANAGAAAKLCATLGAADVMCSTRPYRGERFTP